MARYKGDLKRQVEGADVLDRLEEGAKILISEGCSHHRQCDDIGTVKLPGWIETIPGKIFIFLLPVEANSHRSRRQTSLSIAGDVPLHEKEMKSGSGRLGRVGIPMTNYGILIAKMNGIFKRGASLRLQINLVNKKKIMYSG